MIRRKAWSDSNIFPSRKWENSSPDEGIGKKNEESEEFEYYKEIKELRYKKIINDNKKNDRLKTDERIFKS